MGAPKQKWTPEEEAALRAGVEKYGPGKWRAIQKDPEFAPCLVTRSNVDLKDKWRNMNVGSGGHGSREKSLKSISRHTVVKATDKTTDECISPIPLAVLPREYSNDDTYGIADTLVSSDSSKDRKTLGPRYTDLVVNAINESKDPNGCSASAIAASIEADHPVPSNFRRLLRSKLRDMVNQGSLMKSRQNFKLNVAEPASQAEAMQVQDGDEGKQNVDMYREVGKQMRGILKSTELESPTDRPDAKRSLNISRNHIRKLRSDPGMKKAKLDIDFARSKLKTAEEAAQAAALAVAEAEAAAAAAENAAKEAEAAEAEAEAAEIAAEIAALSARAPKKARAVGFPVEEVAVAV